MRSKIPCRSCGTKSSKSGFVYSGSDELCLCKTCYMKNHNPVPFEDTSTIVSVETQTEKEDFVLEGTVQDHNIDTNVCSQNTVYEVKNYSKQYTIFCRRNRSHY